MDKECNQEEGSEDFEQPKLDTEFPNLEAAYEFYNNYAFHVGFSVRKNRMGKNKNDVPTWRKFCCYKEGHCRKRSSDKSPPKYQRLDERTGCEAHMKVNICKNGTYKVTSFGAEHNHPLATPRKRNFLRSHRIMNVAHKSVADMADAVGIKPKGAYDFMAKQVGGRRHLSFLPDDYKNYLRTKRSNGMLLGDAGAIMQYLQKRIKEDPRFYCNVQLDEADMITNIFWADGRSLLDYKCFGDVVCFDTTYKTNGYGRPLALLVGLNHHKGTVVFGAAFLFDETTESFEWLFETFTEAVGGKAPQVILTDQDKAMSNAIENVWPQTTHRLCVWHMYQNAAKHLSHVFSGSKTFEKDFGHCVYDCQYEEEFLSSWNHMLDNYGLHNNEWLSKLFEDREKWALVYGRHVFCADMKSTQRSESINSVIKRYLDPKQRLLDFFGHFERLLEDRRNAELVADHRAIQGIPKVPFSDMLKQAARIYTPKVYEVFQEEYGKFLNCVLYNSGVDGTLQTYTVIGGYKDRKKECVVQLDSSMGHINCSCKNFEFIGVQCCHVLKVLDTMNVKELPEKYYLKRWRRDAKSGVETLSSETSQADVEASIANRYGSLMHTYNYILSTASQSRRGYEYAQELARDFKCKVEALLQEESSDHALNNSNDIPEPSQKTSSQKNVESISKKANGVKKRDRPRGSGRYKNALEKKEKKKGRSKGAKASKTTASPLEKNKEISKDTQDNSEDTESPLETNGFNIFGAPMFTPNTHMQGPLMYESASQLLQFMHTSSQYVTHTSQVEAAEDN